MTRFGTPWLAVGLVGTCLAAIRAEPPAGPVPPRPVDAAASPKTPPVTAVAPGPAADQPAEKPVEKPVEKPAGKPAQQPTETPAEKPAEKPATPMAEATMQASVEQVAREARSAIAVITFQGREGQQQGLGTGFVVSEDGLIATNLHVLGEARPLTVRLADGSRHEVVEIHASDRHLDLAVIRVRRPPQKLRPLQLGDSDQLRDGMPIVVLGNPQGLQHSVVSGSIVSGTREVEGRKMIQLAIAIEPGNSGGPVLDMEGRVLGIVTLKSLVTKNLGFALEVNALKSLLAQPNPIPMDRWLTIGALDSREWTPLFGSRWQQRAGRIHVVGPGQGFGGRSLCLSRQATPPLPCEVAVQVKLDQESGAAGLVFHADGRDKHYGFYPSGGKLRLSRFSGPDVFSWQVLAERASEHYRPGEWNRLKVRLDKGLIQCFVNDELVIESSDDVFASGAVGLAKFRETEAEFKQFQLAASLPDGRLAPAVAARYDERITALPPLEKLATDHLAGFADDPAAARAVIRARATELERRAADLRRVAAGVHLADVVRRLQLCLHPPAAEKAEEPSLCTAALLVAQLDDEELDVDSYRRQIERMAEEVRKTLPADATEPARLEALNKYLFQDNGFHGSRTEYYHRANSYLNRVLDDREGIPITLSILYMELARRLDLRVLGVGLPGHFIVKHVPRSGEEQLIDVFEGGKPLTREEAAAKVRSVAEIELRDEHLHPLTTSEIIQRCLRNLVALAQEAQDREALLRYLEALVALDPDSAADRGLRAVVKFETGRREAAVAELDWFFERRPPGLDLERIRQMQDFFRHNRPPQIR
ncbi:MAG: tetratricopeptide repeat protein [Pirellulales bacterium]